MNKLLRVLKAGVGLIWGLLLLFPAWLGSDAAQAEEFLEPEAAFSFSARALDANTLEASWKIADGYYLYRQKFRFELQGATLGAAKFPAGEIKQDENFGRVEVYHREVRILLPVSGAGAAPVRLTAVSQGCAEAGLCYTPQTTSATLTLPAAAAPARAEGVLARLGSSASSAFDGLASLTGRAQPRLLPPERAFVVTAKLVDAGTVRFDYAPTADTYLYRDKLGWAVKAPAGVTLKATIPAGEVKDDPSFGKTEVFHRPFAVTLTLSRALQPGEKLALDANWQGCNEAVGVCYPPTLRRFELLAGAGAMATTPAPGDTGAASAPPAAAEASAPPAFTAPPAAEPPPAAESDTGRIERVLKSGSFWLVVVSFFGFGLLLAFTPCVFPMIPILSGIIAGQNHAEPLTKTRGFLLSLAYVLGMAITYALAGVAAALSGTLISNALQNPWALGAGAGIFVLLAFSMFGFFEIQLPSALQSKFSDASNKMKGGHFAGVFVMGVLSAVIVGPCVAPPLAAALAYIAQTGNTTLGGSALFALALGMGVPLLLVGISAGALLPRAGGWMNAVKYAFGVAMLGIAIYLITPVLPAWVGMLLWALLLIGSAIYLHALDPLPEKASGWMRLWKGLGVALLIAGLALLIGLLGGSRDVLQPLDIFKGGGALAAGTPELKFEKVKNLAELDAKLAEAKAAQRPVMLDFYADWCVSCKEMERFTFSDARVRARLMEAVHLQADVTATTAADRALLARFGLFGPPGIVFWRADGAQSDYRVVGFEDADKFLASVNAALR